MGYSILWTFILPVFDYYSILQMGFLRRLPQTQSHFLPQHWLTQQRLLQHSLQLLRHGLWTTLLLQSLMWLERNGSQVIRLVYYILQQLVLWYKIPYSLFLLVPNSAIPCWDCISQETQLAAHSSFLSNHLSISCRCEALESWMVNVKEIYLAYKCSSCSK